MDDHCTHVTQDHGTVLVGGELLLLSCFSPFSLGEIQ